MMKGKSSLALIAGLAMAASMNIQTESAIRESYGTAGAYGGGYKSPTKKQPTPNQAKAARRKMAKASKRKNRK